MKIYVDGVLVFSDTNYTTDTHPPFEFEASSGSSIQFIATDANYCMQQLSNLTIHFGTSYSQELLPDGFAAVRVPVMPATTPTFYGPKMRSFSTRPMRSRFRDARNCFNNSRAPVRV